jgi:hypothetical protein
MADRRDDLDSLTGGHVEPLPPPPGTFELIRHRARRRKLRRLAITAGAAAAFVAAAVTVPQVVKLPLVSAPISAARAGHSSQARSVPATGSRAGPGGTAAVSSAPAPGPAVAAPVPGNFRPSAVTFVGTETGWTIGQAGTPGHCATQYCTSVARTDDAGKTWTGVPAPLTGPADGATGVSQIRFLNASDGWAFGPQLFATTDGGQHWTAVDTGGLRVTDLETAGDRVFGIFAACSGGGTDFAAHCKSFTLYSASASASVVGGGGGGWAPVGTATTGLTGGGDHGSASLVLTGTRGYLLAPDGMVYAGPVDGSAAWRPAGRVPCAVGRPQADGQPAGALLAGGNATDLTVACTPNPVPGGPQKELIFTSTDGGRGWQVGSDAPARGVAASAAASPAGTVVLGTSQGIDVLPAGSTTWQAARLDGPVPAGGFGYVGMTTDEQGVALPADPAAGAVWFTFDGGLSWQPARV